MTDHLTDETLNDYADGVLPVQARLVADAHLEACASCAAELEAIVRMTMRLRSLPSSIEPHRDLRPAIRSRIAAATQEAVPAGFRQRRWMLAAAVLLIATTAVTTRWLMLRELPSGSEVAALRGDPGAGVSSRPISGGAAGAVTQVELHISERRLADEIGDLQRSLDAARTELTPETVRILERNLLLIDGAIAESRRALAADPANASLNRMLLSAYEQKRDLLRRAREATT